MNRKGERMDWSELAAHLFPPFDAWWPNIIANLVWVPFAALAGFLWHRGHRRRHGELKQELAALRKHVTGHATDRQHMEDL
jgi:hypothetical protein